MQESFVQTPHNDIDLHFPESKTALVSVTTVRDKNKTSCVMLLLNEDINLEGLFSLNQTSSILFCLDAALHLTKQSQIT